MTTAAQTAQHKRRFLKHFAEFGNVLRAAQAAKIERRRVYDWLEKDEAFATAYRFAEVESTEVLEDEARRRAVDGVDKQRRVYDNRGNLIDEYTETSYSDTLLIFLLKARNPGKYRDNARLELTGADGNPIDIHVESKSTLASRIAGLAARVRAEELAGQPD